MKDYKYLFSVIVTMYNAEKYLVESVESLVNQTIGFENIQLILINDASTDKSGEICLTYKNRYPDNIVVDELRDKISISNQCLMCERYISHLIELISDENQL